jgi:hypothetical protein
MDDPISGLGENEMLPEKGDPFRERKKTHNPGFEDQVVIPSGEERSLESSQSDTTVTGESPTEAVHHEGDEYFEDGGMSAVGPLLPEDLEAVEPPAPDREMELPGKESKPSFSTLHPETGTVEESLPPFLRSSSREGNGESENLLVSDIRINWLLERASQLEERVNREIENVHLRRLLHKEINLTRKDQIGNRDQFDEAERILNEVENRIQLAEQVRSWSASIRTRLLLYEMVLSILVIAGLVGFPSLVANFFATNFPEQSVGLLGGLENLSRAMLWGGLGGICSALIGLQTHAAVEEEVDRRWALWYLAAPFMGLVLGALIFLAARAGFLILLPSSDGQVEAMWVVYGLCWLIGFQQHLAYETVERVVGLIDRRKV